MNYNSYPQEYTATITARTSQTMKRVYVNMTLALVVTAFVSLWCAGSEAFLSFIFSNRWAMWALLIAEIGIVLGISAGINKLSNTTATLLFYLFAVINGGRRARANIPCLHRRIHRQDILHHSRHFRRHERVWIFHVKRPVPNRQHTDNGIVRPHHSLRCQYLRP